MLCANCQGRDCKNVDAVIIEIEEDADKEIDINMEKHFSLEVEVSAEFIEPELM